MDCRDVAFECVEAVLGRYHFVSFRLKRRDQFTEARTIRPESMSEYNAWSITSRLRVELNQTA